MSKAQFEKIFLMKNCFRQIVLFDKFILSSYPDIKLKALSVLQQNIVIQKVIISKFKILAKLI